MVVPMFAPKIIAIATGKLITSADTNPITITVVALELCNIAVEKAPARTPRRGFFPIRDMILLILEPAAFFRLSLIRFIPNRNIASPPKSPKIIFKFAFIKYLFDRECSL